MRPYASGEHIFAVAGHGLSQENIEPFGGLWRLGGKVVACLLKDMLER